MSGKQFKLSKYVTPSSVSYFCDENGRMLNKEVVKVLNEQQSIIRRDEMSIKTMMSNMKKLEEENEHLRKRVKAFSKESYCIDRKLEKLGIQYLNKQYEELQRLREANKELQLQLEAFKDKLCELGVSDVKLYGKRYYTGLEEWLND